MKCGPYSGDSTALVAVNDLGQILVLGVWEKPAGEGGRKADTWRVPRDEVNAAVHAAFARFNVAMMLADPPYWQTEIEAWRRAYPKRVVDFPTGVSARMAPACTGFYTAVMEGRLTDCTPPGALKDALAAHLANCATKPTPHGTVITKQKEWSPKKIDLAIATVVAASVALVPATPRRQVFVL